MCRLPLLLYWSALRGLVATWATSWYGCRQLRGDTNRLGRAEHGCTMIPQSLIYPLKINMAACAVCLGWRVVEIEGKNGPQTVESDLIPVFVCVCFLCMAGTSPLEPCAPFLHPMFYSYHLLTLPTYKSVKLFLCVDSRGAWSLVSCLKPTRKCAHVPGAAPGVCSSTVPCTTLISLIGSLNTNSWRSNWYSTRKCN